MTAKERKKAYKKLIKIAIKLNKDHQGVIKDQMAIVIGVADERQQRVKIDCAIGRMEPLNQLLLPIVNHLMAQTEASGDVGEIDFDRFLKALEDLKEWVGL